MDQNKSGRLSVKLTDIEVAYILGTNDAGAYHCQISALISCSHSAIWSNARAARSCTSGGTVIP